MMDVLDRAGSSKRLFGADSFKGLPEAEEGDLVSCKSFNAPRVACSPGTPGSYASSKDTFLGNVKKAKVQGHRLRVVEGWFNETLPPADLEKVSFLRLDGDMYASTMDALRALYPLVSPGGVVYIDDYGTFAGCEQAVEEYRQEANVSAPMHRILEQSDDYRRVNGKELSAEAKAKYDGRSEAVWWVKREGDCAGAKECLLLHDVASSQMRRLATEKKRVAKTRSTTERAVASRQSTALSQVEEMKPRPAKKALTVKKRRLVRKTIKGAVASRQSTSLSQVEEMKPRTAKKALTVKKRRLVRKTIKGAVASRQSTSLSQVEEMKPRTAKKALTVKKRRLVRKTTKSAVATRMERVLAPALAAYANDRIDTAELERRKTAARVQAKAEHEQPSMLDAALGMYDVAVAAVESALGREGKSRKSR